MKLLRRLWNDDAGFVISTELVLVATLLVIAMVVGLASIRDQVTSELSDVAGAISEIDQSFIVYGASGHSAAVEGFNFEDLLDYCDQDNEQANVDASACVVLGIDADPNLEEGATQTPGNLP